MTMYLKLSNFILVVSAMVASGADTGARNVYQWTPLDCAAAYGHLKSAEILLNVILLININICPPNFVEGIYLGCLSNISIHLLPII